MMGFFAGPAINILRFLSNLWSFRLELQFMMTTIGR